MSEHVLFPMVIPLFPLPDHVLLPGAPVPFRVFEPRYRDLVEDLMARDLEERWLAMPRLAAGWKGQASPPFEQVAVAARLLECQAIDGQYLVAIEGIERCRLREVDSTHRYRLAHATYLPDQGSADLDALQGKGALLDQILLMLCQHAPRFADAIGDVIGDWKDPSLYVWRLAAMILRNPDHRQDFLQQTSCARRADVLTEILTDALTEVGAPLTTA